MDTVDEEKLRKEIQYLTRLIEAHKAIKEFKGKGKHSKTTSSKGTEASAYKWRNSSPCRGVSVPSWTNPGSISSYQLLGSKHLAGKEKEASLQDWHASQKLEAPAGVSDKASVSVSGNSVSRRSVVTCGSRDNKVHSQPVPSSSKSLDSPRLGGRREERCQTTPQGKRKRSSSNSSGREFRKKRKKFSILAAACLPQNKYVWQAHTSGKNQIHHLPDHSKLKWRQELLETGSCSHSHDSRTPFSTVETTGREHGSVAAASAFSNPFIIKRYKMRRVSAAGRSHLASPTATRSRLGSDSFSQRRLKYIIKHSPFSARKRRLSSYKTNFISPTSSKPTVSLRPTVHRVWRPPSIDPVGLTEASGHMTGGSEVKTQGGNKQWLSASEKKTPSRRLSGHRKRQRLISIEGSKYVLRPGGRSLQRLATTPVERIGRGSLITTPTTSRAHIQSPTIKQLLASNALHKSRNRVWLSRKKDLERKNKSQYCIYYNRFGRCNRGKKCLYVHDPERVAICGKFLRGMCDKTDGSCPFSHKVSKEKMPVCSYFIRGLCIREDCPYLHVRVDQDAAVCANFIRGLCPQGEECTLQHVVDCPEFSQQGSCPRGKRCPLRHRQRAGKGNHHKEERMQEVASVKEPYMFRKLRQKEENRVQSHSSPFNLAHPSTITPAQLEFIPLDTETVPEFIAL